MLLDEACALRSWMQNDSKRNPKVLKSISKYSGDNPKAATTIEGSTRFLFFEGLTSVLEWMARHHVNIINNA